MYANSLDKIVFSYFAAVTKRPILYRSSKLIVPKPLVVSPRIFTGFNCPEKCGGCCPQFSLEYLPTELCPSVACFRYTVELNGEKFPLVHDPQDSIKTHFCRHLSFETGRCAVYQKRPFHCDFELLRVIIGKKHNRLTQQMFGRGWNFLRVDNQRGCLCVRNVEPTEYARGEVLRKLKRLKEWTDHFRLETWLPEIINWVVTGPHTKPLILMTNEQLTDSIAVVEKK